MTNDKDLVAEAARQPGAPPDLRQRADNVLTGLALQNIAAAVERAAGLVADVRAATARRVRRIQVTGYTSTHEIEDVLTRCRGTPRVNVPQPASQRRSQWGSRAKGSTATEEVVAPAPVICECVTVAPHDVLFRGY